MKSLLFKAFLTAIIFGFFSGHTIAKKEETSSRKICGPFFWADNSNSGIAPEMNNITISNTVESYIYYVCCGNDGFLAQWQGGGDPFTITVVVESDWSGGTASIGVRYRGSSVIQCEQYVYGKGTYVFSLPTTWCDSFEVFVSPTAYC